MGPPPNRPPREWTVAGTEGCCSSRGLQGCALQPACWRLHSLEFVFYAPDGRALRDPGQADGRSAALLPITMLQRWFDRQQVRGGPDGHLLLEPAGAVSARHQHKGIVCIRLQPSDQLPLQGAWNLHALLVVEDLEASSTRLFRRRTEAEAKA